MSEKLSILIDSSVLHEDALEVNDALNQLQDMFALLGGENDVSWKIVEASKQSPLTIGVESFSVKHTPPVAAAYAKASKEKFETNIISLLEGRMPFEWSRGVKYQTATGLLGRTQNGIGKFEIDFCDEFPPIKITPVVAGRAYKKIMSRQSDLRRNELGTIDGHIVDISEHYGNPAMQIFDRLRRVNVWCVVPREHVDILAESNDWKDVWDKQRVKVRGQINYNRDGTISRVTLREFTKVISREIPLERIRDTKFTGGLPPDKYLESLEEA